MKVLLLNGSPRREGCTHRALAEVKKALEENGVEAEIIHVGGENVSGCKACMTCRKPDFDGKCVIDDIVNEVAPKVIEADGIILGSPVYAGSPNGSFIALLDRLVCVTARYLPHKFGASVVAARRSGTTNSLNVLNMYFTINQIHIVSSQYWNMVHGWVTEDVEQDKEGLQAMRTLGNNMAYLIKAVKAAEASGIKKPVSEPHIKTNYIRLPGQ